MKKNSKVICFGEILMDVFPDMERIGGAPLNVASRLASMGLDVELISKVGSDAKGVQLKEYLESKNISINNIAEDPINETGMVAVKLSESGSATYTIKYPAAWDKIELTDRMCSSVKNADALVYGSLVCRDEVSRNTLLSLLPQANYRILDYNLRPPHYNKELLIELMQHANFIKFNDDELFEIAALMGSKYKSLEQNLLFMAVHSNADTICVTKGHHGAVLMRDKKFFYNSGYKMEVQDTVGAGDSFLGTLVAKLLQENSPQTALHFACAVGALVAGREGANPDLTSEEIENFMNPPEYRHKD